ncbi:TPA: heme A synthase [Vibrio vulnificus]|nr:heme A synthase [Vibrio vulnificus]HAS6237191.1 heme A synthase [Vibrio vulnificus]HAT8513750.1 heme A synthase [Vibrio vulnificus]
MVEGEGTMNLHRIMVQIALVLTSVVILLGAYTRLSDAGLGCPDWPGCYGHLTVPNTAAELSVVEDNFPGMMVEPNKAWLEMIHRYFAGSLGILIFAITLLCLFKAKAPKVVPIVLSLLVVAQALLGMWTVTMKLMPVVVMAHLLGGFLLFVLLAILYCQLKPTEFMVDWQFVDPRLRFFSFFVIAVVVLQILLGGWTSSNYAALMCSELPICEGDWVSYLDWKNAFDFWNLGHHTYEFGVLEYPARMTIHVTHRIGAMVTFFCVMTYCFWLYQQSEPIVQQLAIAIGLVLLAQVGLGISNVLYQLPLSVAVAHNLGAALLIMLVSVSSYVLWQEQPGIELNIEGFKYE